MNQTADSEEQQEVTLEQALAIAIQLHQSEQFEAAADLYRQILDLAPDYPSALHFSGLLKCQTGERADGIASIERAIQLAPDYADAHNNLGNLLQLDGKLEQAAECYRQALTYSPDNPAAHNNHGLVLKDLARFEEAIDSFRRALDLMPENAGFLRNLGNTLKKLGRFEESIEAFRKALELSPYNADDYESLCAVLYFVGQYDQAIPLVRQWLTLDPQNPLALHRLASFSGEQLSKASEDYVSQTFDSFADSFDWVLKRLEYKAPFLVADALAECSGKPDASLDILDAGCGTGLCGPLIKSFAKTMVGVDLSAKMLARAALRECYTELQRSELVAWMHDHPEQYDAIISADTLVYLGDLTAATQAAARALRKGGHFIFTLERSDEPLADGYKINAHGRFSHDPSYIETVLSNAGFSQIVIKNVHLRFEIDAQVEGCLVCAVNQ